MELRRPLNSLYIHIPFCRSKCFYCSFISFADKSDQIESYINALLAEMEEGLKQYPDTEIKSIYIGGGTPSLLEARYYDLILDKIRQHIAIAENAEITIEANPGTVSLEYLESIKATGINRISIGVQSFSDSILRLLNRTHTELESVEAIALARKAGFQNISIDLIYGLPTLTLQMWEEDLGIAAIIGVQHISAYGLKIEEGTEFARKLPGNLPGEEISSEMYVKTIDILSKHKFEHYEISNYALPGYKSRHNLAYWNNEEYFGFGLGAHGYLDGVRYSNSCDFEEYLNNPLAKASEHEVTKREAIEEGVFLGLRLIKGINVEKFNQEYDINLINMYKDVIEKYINYGFMEYFDGYLRLTHDGILISNSILADFLE